MNENMEQVQSDLDKLFQPEMENLISRRGNERGKLADTISYRDLRNLKQNLQSISDYRTGRSSQLQMATPPARNISQIASMHMSFERQRTDRDERLPTKQLRARPASRSLIFADVRNQQLRQSVGLPQITIKQKGAFLRFTDKDMNGKMNASMPNAKYQLIVEDDTNPSAFFLTQQK